MAQKRPSAASVQAWMDKAEKERDALRVEKEVLEERLRAAEQTELILAECRRLNDMLQHDCRQTASANHQLVAELRTAKHRAALAEQRAELADRKLGRLHDIAKQIGLRALKAHWFRSEEHYDDACEALIAWLEAKIVEQMHERA